MNTIEMINKLRDMVGGNYSLAGEFPWNELFDCVDRELVMRRHLYPDTQYNTIYDRVKGWRKDIYSDMSGKNVLSILDKLADMFEYLPETDYTCNRYEEANYARAYWNHWHYNTIIVLGDSHVNFFGGDELLNFIPIGHGINTCPLHDEHKFTPLHLGPCLAYNVDNINATYNSLEKTNFLCDNFIKPESIIICSFGEIDIRVHALKQAQIQNVPVETVIDNILSHYSTLLLRLKERGYHVYCWGPIATQKDDNEQDEQFPHYGAETDRNKATEYYNRRLESWCESNDIGFMTIFDKMVDADYHTIIKYLSDDGCHLSQRALTLAQEELKKLYSRRF